MNSYQFEDFVVNLFKQLGFCNIKAGSETAIRGVDITIEKTTELGGKIKYLVQCEHQPQGVIGLPVVKILHSTVVSTPTLDKGLIVTSGRFSSHAIRFAEEMGIELIDAWKLIELGKKAGLGIQKKLAQQIEDCFPVSNKSQIVVKLFDFLKKDLQGFEEKSSKVEDIALRLEPFYIMDFSIDATFSTSVGIIHQINESSSTFLTDKGELVNPMITNNFLPLKHTISKVDLEKLQDIKKIDKRNFTKSIKEVKKSAKDSLRKLYTKKVVYYGANNVRYEKICTPRQKHISIWDIKPVYVPFWNFFFSLLKQQYFIVGFETSYELNVLPSRMIIPKADVEAKIYPDNCMICSRDIKNEKYLCSECGFITCHSDSFECKSCGRLVCRNHTTFKRKFLVLSDKYCPTCAISMGIKSEI